VRVVAQKAKHDEVGVETVEAVTDVRVVRRLRLREADVFHDLVFTFSGDLK
jgi:hypothetical protein